MKHEEIIPCAKSGGDLCYKTQINPDLTTYLSLSCGFWTNTLMKEGEEFYEQQMATLPELHKDIAWKDPKTDLVWLPNLINQEGKGMIFANGPSKENWGWAAVKSIKIPEEERENHPIPGKKGEYMEYKTDMATMKMFHERDYIDALSFIEILPEGD